MVHLAFRVYDKRKHKMFARFDRMAKAFTRIGKDIAIAVKAGGPNPDNNPRLRMSIQNAKGVNMPKDRVDAAIKRAVSKEEKDFQEVIYEGYAPHGVPVDVFSACVNEVKFPFIQGEFRRIKFEHPFPFEQE